MTELKEFFGQDYPGFNAFCQNIIEPIFTDCWKADPYLDSLDFEDDDLLDNNQELRTAADNCKIKHILKLGIINLKNSNPITVYDITISDKVALSKNRLGIQRVIHKVMNTQSGAFMLFHYENVAGWEWRFSYSQKDTGNEDITNAKRYTFLLGKNQSCRTAAENFKKLMDMKGNIAIDDVKTAFDVEALSKEFFKKYKEQYEKFCDYIYKHKKEQDKFGAEFATWPDKTIRDYVKKLLGRLVFLHFLQKKGWMGVPQNGQWGQGDFQFMKTLFDCSSKSQKENFLDEVLEPLFFDALDTDRGDAALFDTHVALHQGSVVRIPYLNGGLFEQDELDKPKSKFPAEYFEELLEFFYEYNFTIDENDPNDAQVGVDPEMLGRIFENLLEDNKDKGAFYTPKEIVQYMCRESLIAYLQTDAEDEAHKERLRTFVTTHDASVLKYPEYVRDHIKKVKICDPAIGSGAFPMGLLNELIWCREALNMQIGDTFNPAEEKRHVIQNNIYGVDIEKGAVDIARLRFWLSLIVDEEKPETLPNLDYKIMQGNSLLESYDGIDLSCIATSTGNTKKNLGQIEMSFDETDDIVNIHRDINLYYAESDHNKRRKLRESINSNIRSYIIHKSGADAVLESELNEMPIPNDKFFLWHTYFADVFKGAPDESGFDIVIGNPPYGATLSKEEKEILIENYTTAKSIKNVQKGSLDTFTLFIELGYYLVRKNGNLAYIVPIAITSSDAVAGVHKLLIENCEKISISSYAVRPQPVFDNAVVNTSIIMFRKTNTSCSQLLATKMHRKGKGFNLINLINNLKFADVKDYCLYGRIPKISESCEISILRKLYQADKLKKFSSSNGKPIFYRSTGGRYFKVVTNYPTGSSKEKAIYLLDRYANAIGCILSSNISFWFYQIYSNNLDWRTYELDNFPIPDLDEKTIKQLDMLYTDYLIDIEKYSEIQKSTGKSKYKVDEFKVYKIGKSKAIIDKIDDIICPLYGLTPEETKFIKNYEIEFRIDKD